MYCQQRYAHNADQGIPFYLKIISYNITSPNTKLKCFRHCNMKPCFCFPFSTNRMHYI